MASSTSRVSFRITFILLLLIATFYVGRPLYWKLTATIQEIGEKKTSVKEGISQFVLDAQRSVGWIYEPNVEVGEDQSQVNIGVATSRRILRLSDSKRKW